MSSAEARREKPATRILCIGVAVLDEVFRVENFARPDVKTPASEYVSVNGGNAANAAVAIAHLGGRARFVGPLGGPAGEEPIGDRWLALMRHENIECDGCPRLPGVRSPISAIAIDPHGERAIITYRDERLSDARLEDPAALVADAHGVCTDNRFPEFVMDACLAARARGIPIVLDADEPRRNSDDLLPVATHIVFSAEGLRATARNDDLAGALVDIAERTASFLAVTDGSKDVLWLDVKTVRRMPAFKVDAVDTLGAGDTFHGAFALMLAEGADVRDAMRFAAAAAAIKCTRFGGIASAPTRADVEAFLKQR